jgi:nitroreductase
MGQVFETYRFVVVTLFGEIGYSQLSQTIRHHKQLEVTIMTATETIRARRTIFKFKPGSVPNEDIEQILSFGIWAPNHHITEPWRFTVIGEETKLILADRYREIKMEDTPDHVDAENLEKIGELAYEKFMSKPTIIAVSCLQEGDEQRRREDYAATCCAVQNVQLAAWEKGVGMQWSTGAITMEEGTYRLLGIDSEQEYIIGFLYTGYPEEIREPQRKPFDEVLRWTV